MNECFSILHSLDPEILERGYIYTLIGTPSCLARQRTQRICARSFSVDVDDFCSYVELLSPPPPHRSILLPNSTLIVGIEQSNLNRLSSNQLLVSGVPDAIPPPPPLPSLFSSLP
jgi:hypothetical protein